MVVQLSEKDRKARRLLAGADILAAPARFEPCGLIQMYAMRFGTLPVREVGGLADTVIGHRDPARGPTGGLAETNREVCPKLCFQSGNKPACCPTLFWRVSRHHRRPIRARRDECRQA